MAKMVVESIQPDEAPYEKPNVRVCRDDKLIREALPEGFLDPHIETACQAFRKQRPEWDGAFYLALAFGDSDAGKLFIYDSLLSDDDNDPISYQVRLRDKSEAAFRHLQPKLGWTW
jgi:hypothetical protein